MNNQLKICLNLLILERTDYHLLKIIYKPFYKPEMKKGKNIPAKTCERWWWDREALPGAAYNITSLELL